MYNRLLRLYVESAKANPDASPDVDRLIQESDASVREVLVELLSPRYTLQRQLGHHAPDRGAAGRKSAAAAGGTVGVPPQEQKVMRLLEENRQRLKEAHERRTSPRCWNATSTSNG